MIALTPKERFSYVLECDRNLPEDEQTVFELRPLSIAEETKVQDALFGGGDAGMTMRTGTGQLMRLRFGLVGCKNLLDASGSEVPFETSKGSPRHVTDAFLERLGPDARAELSDAIAERGEVSEAEGK